MKEPNEALRGYRELLRYVLQEFQTKGGRLTLPVGCYHLEDWLLDAISVPVLLRLLQTEREVNLVQACEGNGGSSVLPGLPGPLAQGIRAAKGMPASAAEAAPKEDSSEPVCDLQLPLPPTGMAESDLKELAYILFIGCCSMNCSADLSADVRRQLEISEGMAASIQKLLVEAGSTQSRPASTLEMVVMLLQIARPSHFQSFRSFVQWRQASAAAICQSLALGAAEAGGQVPNGRPLPSVRQELLRLKTSLRGLEVPSSEDFDEEVYAEAANAVVAAATGVANVSGLGWGLPWAIRVRIAELLMAAGFDASDDGSPIAEQQHLVQVLRHSLWPLLGLLLSLHDVLNAWAYLRQFALTGNAGLLSSGRDLIDEVRLSRTTGRAPDENGRLTSSYSAGPREADGDAFVDSAMAAVGEWVAARLSDYRKNFEDAGPIPGLLEVLLSSQRCLGRQADVGQMLESCIGASVEVEFQRMVREVNSSGSGPLPKDAERIVNLARGCTQILDAEVTYFSPLFAGHVRRPAEVAAVRMHHCFNSHLLPWLRTVHTLEESNLEAIRQSVALEGKLQAALAERVSEGMEWAILERLTPLLHLWVSNQLSLVNSWQERIAATETWQPVSQPRGCSRSAVESVKIVRETLEGLFDLRLELPEEVVVAAAGGLDHVLQRYAQRMAAEVGSADALVPALPPLTRYKREVAVKAAATDSGSAPATPPRHHRSGSIESTARSAVDEERIERLTPSSLIVRLNSLNYIRAQLPAMGEIIAARWHIPEGSGQAWTESLFDDTQSSVARAIESIVHFTCMKVVYRDLAGAFSVLYKHQVAQARISPLLEALDASLGGLCTSAEVELHGALARGLLQATLDAILRALLHGGPNRWFVPEDVDLIEEDLEDLRILFHAEGEGLETEEIVAMCRPLSDLLTVLQLDTGILVNNLKQVLQAEKMGRPPSKQPLAYDKEVLQHVLAHRGDHAASKFLKKEYSLPKRTEGSASVFGSKLQSLSSFGQPKKEASNGGTGMFSKGLSFGKFGAIKARAR